MASHHHPLSTADARAAMASSDAGLDVLRKLWDPTVTGTTCCKRKCAESFLWSRLRNLCLNYRGVPASEKTGVLSGTLIGSRSFEQQQAADRRPGRPGYVKEYGFYSLLGKHVCATLYRAVFGISPRVLYRSKRIAASMLTEDFEGFDEKRGGVRDGQRVSPSSADFVIKFLDDICNDYGLPDPGRINSSSSFGATILIPHEFNKTKMFSMYEEKISESEIPKVSYKTFLKIWTETRPNVQILPIRSDMCSTCARYQCKIQHMLAQKTVESADEIDTEMENFKKHREDAKTARKFYNLAREKAKEAYRNRTVVDGKDHVSLLVVSMDFAENYQVPNHGDEPGELFFKSPVKVGLFAVCDEGAEENAVFIMPEKQTLEKNGSAVASMLMRFLKKRNVTFDNLIVFADNTVAQNKNQFVMSCVSLIATCGLFGCQGARMSFMVVGHTKFGPDGVIGTVKRKLKYRNINTILDVEQAIWDTNQKQTARALGHEGHATIPIFTNCPFNGNPLFKTYDFTKFSRFYCKKLVGQTLWYDIKFKKDGSILTRSPPCGDHPESVGKIWEPQEFILDPTSVRKLDLSTIPDARQTSYQPARIKYLFEEIRQHVHPGAAVYEHHQDKGEINYRTFTCPAPPGVDESQICSEEMQLRAKVYGPTLLKSVVEKMTNEERIRAILNRDDSRSLEQLKSFNKKRLIEILKPHTQS